MNCYLCQTRDLTVLTTQLRDGTGSVEYCKACGIGMLNDCPTNLKQYYEKEYRGGHGPKPNEQSDYPEIFEAYVNYQAQRVAQLQPWLKPTTRLLEIGCSTGHFLYNVKPLVKEVIGIDYDPGAAEFAGRVCQCTTYGCDFDDAGLSPASFDLVCAIQTVEHLEDPIGFVARLGKYLKPDGIAYIEVPSLSDPLLAIYDNPSYRKFYFHRAHPFTSPHGHWLL